MRSTVVVAKRAAMDEHDVDLDAVTAWDGRCGREHWNQLPKRLHAPLEQFISGIGQPKALILAQKAVLLEYLPPAKAEKVSAALDAGLLSTQYIPSAFSTLVLEPSQRRSIFDFGEGGLVRRRLSLTDILAR
jgi:hypothetical protein